MSNLSTLPKGDSAWLLRKAIERIMEQVSVLETNIGSSTTGNSANNQIIFNDNGTLRGDTGLTYSKTTDLLTAGSLIVSGNVQLATVSTLFVGTLANPKLKVDVGGTGVTTITEATITGDLTVDTNVLKVDTTNNRVGIGTASPVVGSVLDVAGTVSISGGTSNARRLQFNASGAYANWIEADGVAGANYLRFAAGNAEVMRIDQTGVCTWSDGAGGTRMTLNSTGLGIGDAPQAKLHAAALNPTNGVVQLLQNLSTSGQTGAKTKYEVFNVGASGVGTPNGTTNALAFFVGGITSAEERARIDASGNLGIGVTPSVWNSSYKALQVGAGIALFNNPSGTNNAWLTSNFFFDSSNANTFIGTGYALMYRHLSGEHAWFTSTVSGTANAAATMTQIMTLDASGNLLVGPTSGTYHIIRKNVASDLGNAVFEIQGNGGTTSSIYYGVTGYNANAANAASKFGRDATTLRSINAGGTVNASGADYAEYMVKCGDFVIAKGDVAGIDKNGKLTNVFADAVSFVVKSTDPSYVGNDKWGVDLEGAAIQSARQLVDRIAFAGQVPVNVIGATAGDYIVPVVDGTGIKGISVSNPTFEQYQLAVGKVITIDTDGRARIIVKLA